MSLWGREGRALSPLPEKQAGRTAAPIWLSRGAIRTNQRQKRARTLGCIGPPQGCEVLSRSHYVVRFAIIDG
jgi:hypothetical protein